MNEHSSPVYDLLTDSSHDIWEHHGAIIELSVYLHISDFLKLRDELSKISVSPSIGAIETITLYSLERIEVRPSDNAFVGAPVFLNRRFDVLEGL